MEDILSSIKRIIAEEGEGAPSRPRRGKPAPLPSHSADPAPFAEEEVLELTSPMQPVPEHPVPEEDALPMSRVQPAFHEPEPAAQPIAPQPTPPQSFAPQAHAAPTTEPIASEPTVQASRAALDSLSRLFVKPEPGTDGTLEGLVREMLRPMLREWMDSNLPPMVEGMVAKEIARITGQG